MPREIANKALQTDSLFRSSNVLPLRYNTFSPLHKLPLSLALCECCVQCGNYYCSEDEVSCRKSEMLVFLCGKMGAGKSTKSSELAKERNAVLLSEDAWLESLYPNQIRSLEDYVKYSNMIKPLVKSLAQDILKNGSNVIMDFPANTISQRNWLKSIFAEIGAAHELIYLDVPNEVCLKQIAKRRVEQPGRAATDTEDMFLQITRYFVEPSPEEGFNLTTIERRA